MDYDDSTVPEGPTRAVPGIYTFRVEDATDETFRSCNHGVKLVLMTAAFPDRDIKVTTRLVFVKSALWKVKEFLDSVGLPFSPPPPTESLIGLTGSAEYELDEKGYLTVARFIPASANNGPDNDAPF